MGRQRVIRSTAGRLLGLLAPPGGCLAAAGSWPCPSWWCGCRWVGWGTGWGASWAAACLLLLGPLARSLAACLACAPPARQAHADWATSMRAEERWHLEGRTSSAACVEHTQQRPASDRSSTPLPAAVGGGAGPCAAGPVAALAWALWGAVDFAGCLGCGSCGGRGCSAGACPCACTSLCGCAASGGALLAAWPPDWLALALVAMAGASGALLPGSGVSSAGSAGLLGPALALPSSALGLADSVVACPSSSGDWLASAGSSAASSPASPWAPRPFFFFFSFLRCLRCWLASCRRPWRQPRQACLRCSAWRAHVRPGTCAEAMLHG